MAKPFKGTINVDIRDSEPDWVPFEPPVAPYAAPNVVYIVLDDVGFSAMRCYGGPVETPNIDRIASQGVRYTQWHTTALCSPTRSCLLTVTVDFCPSGEHRLLARLHYREATERSAERVQALVAADRRNCHHGLTPIHSRNAASGCRDCKSRHRGVRRQGRRRSGSVSPAHGATRRGLRPMR